MPLITWECLSCAFKKETFKKSPICERCGAPLKKFISAPQAKFMEKTDSFKNKSNIKGQQDMLLKRSREHSRDHMLDELVQTNEVEIATKNRWLVENSDGSLSKRKKIDDI